MRSPKHFTTPAIILKRQNYSEADRILTLFTLKQGKITALAKGVRKPSSRKRGHIELFNHFNAHLIQGKNWYILTEAETIPNNFSYAHIEPQQQLNTISNAYQYVELIDKLLPEQQAHQEVFHLLTNTFSALGKAEIDNSALDGYFKNRLIRELGFWPSNQTTPPDIDEFLNSILEKPLKTKTVWNKISPKVS